MEKRHAPCIASPNARNVIEWTWSFGRSAATLPHAHVDHRTDHLQRQDEHERGQCANQQQSCHPTLEDTSRWYQPIRPIKRAEDAEESSPIEPRVREACGVQLAASTDIRSESTTEALGFGLSWRTDGIRAVESGDHLTEGQSDFALGDQAH